MVLVHVYVKYVDNSKSHVLITIIYDLVMLVRGKDYSIRKLVLCFFY